MFLNQDVSGGVGVFLHYHSTRSIRNAVLHPPALLEVPRFASWIRERDLLLLVLLQHARNVQRAGDQTLVGMIQQYPVV